MRNQKIFLGFQPMLPDTRNLLDSLDASVIEEGYVYASELSQEMSEMVIFLNIISAFHLFIVIPSNLFTLVVMAKSKSLWTPSNAVLGVNGFFMTIGSMLMLVLRLGGNFPLLLFDEKQRVVVYEVAWWVFTLTFRIGNTRY